MTDINSLAEAIVELEGIMKKFVDYKQASDEQFSMFFNEMQSLKIKWKRELLEEDEMQDAYYQQEIAKSQARGIISAIEDN